VKVKGVALVIDSVDLPRSNSSSSKGPLKHASARHPPARLLLKAKIGRYTIFVMLADTAINGIHTLATTNLYHEPLLAWKLISECGVYLSGNSDNGLGMMMISSQNDDSRSQ